MSEIEDNKLDELTRKAVFSTAQRSPVDFTQQVMNKVSEIKINNEVTTYHPLISSKVWVGICAFALFIFGYAFIESTESLYMNNLWQQLNFELPNWKAPAYEINFHTPATFVYGMVFLALMVMVEISIISRYFSSKFRA